MASPVLTIFLLALIFMGTAEGAQQLTDCCLQTTDKVVPKSRASGYFIQEARRGCKIDATIIITKRNKKLCISHPDKNPAVAALIQYLDLKNKVHKKRSTN